MTRDWLCVAQKTDPTLHKCFASVVSTEQVNRDKVAYFVEQGILMRKWSPPVMIPQTGTP